MSFKHDVFVSYASEDKVFARRLVDWLERVDELDVWFAEEDMSAGSDVQRQIVEDVGRTRHHVFVISDDWLRKDWTCWERDLVLESFTPPGQRVVPIQRVPRDVGQLGPKLSRLKSVDWPPACDEDDDACYTRFWQLLCGLGFFEPGKEKDWAENGRQALGLSVSAPSARSMAPAPAPGSRIIASGHDEADHQAARQAGRRGSPEALTCDRDPQWTDFERFVTDRRHEAMLVVGPQGEGHRFFLERVVSCLRHDPARRICEVRWPMPPPQARGPAFDAIARAIGCPPDRLHPELRSILAKQNLVLVHQPPFEEARCDSLIRYYDEWLPELIGAIEPPEAPLEGKLKVVQAIRWPEVNALKCGLFQVAKLVGASPRRLQTRCAKAEAAERLLRELGGASGRLPVRLLEKLAPISEADLVKWSETLPDLDGSARRALVDHALGGERSVDILSRIVERLEPLRSVRT